METVKLTLPFPPSVNHYWRHVVLGNPPKQRAATLLSADGRKYKDAVDNVVKRQGGGRGLAGYVAVHVMLHYPDKRRRDLDNHAKALLDALVESRVLLDDSQIRDLHLVRGDVLAGGKAVVTIREIAPAVEQVPLMLAGA